MSERALTDAVIECAQRLGWRAVHIRPARTATGWRTPVQGDGVGFFDLLLFSAAQGRTIYAELKSDTGRFSAEQIEWMHYLCDVSDEWQRRCPECNRRPFELYHWFVFDWTSGDIEAVLRGEEW